jgi:CRISPR/Cas system endoribonuclease Cas6 (RAMP superfamily)
MAHVHTFGAQQATSNTVGFIVGVFQSVVKFFQYLLGNPIVRFICWSLFFYAIMAVTFNVALAVMGYNTYAAVASFAGWGSVVAFVAAAIPGVNALSIVAGFVGWIVAAICQSAMQAIAAQAFYWAVGVAVIAYFVVTAYIRGL